ncbi:MAG: HAD hydrolase-like protein, partial [Rhodospirillales bacterium]|nr:HAD hydrolase-like protein [Rhodospirillales bacterium]
MSAASTGGARPPAILFDWDNTLIDSWPIIHAANNAAMKAMGLPEWTFDQTKTRVRKSMRDAYPEIFGDRWEEAGEVFYAHYRTHHLDELRSITGIEDMLSALKDAGIYMGVVSNKT